MSGILWQLNRLRAMGLREIVFRVWRAVGQRIEGIMVYRGWSPAAPKVVSGKCLFPELSGWEESWKQMYHFSESDLDDLMRGNIGFFGYPSMDFGQPINWHRDPLTGISSPLVFGKSLNYRNDRVVGNVKVIWELGRHQHLIPLAVAYAVSGNTDYKKAVVSQIEGWIQDNPYGLGIHWCSALEVALRLTAWAMIHSLFVLRDGQEGLFKAVESPDLLGNSIYCQSRFIRHFLSRYSSANNHLIGELTGLFVACSVFDCGDKGRLWASFAQKELEKEALLQVYSDGVGKEQAFYYQLWVLEYFLLCWLVGERSDLPFSREFTNKITLMAKFLRDVAPAGGEVPQVGDADNGFVTRFSESWPDAPYFDVLSSVKVIFENCLFDSIVPEKAFWYALIADNLLSNQLTEEKCKNTNNYPVIYQEGGYAILGGNGMHLLFDAGSLGYTSIAAHGHADALSICFSMDNIWWLVDPGTYEYHSNPVWRNYFRGTSAHNTIRIDEQDQSEIGGAFLWNRHAHAHLVNYTDEAEQQYAIGEHDGYKGLGLIHQREVMLLPHVQEMLIQDRIRGSGHHEAEIYFHFAAEVSLHKQGDKWIATRKDTDKCIQLEVDGAWQWDQIFGQESPPLGWFSGELGSKLPANTLRGSYTGSFPVELKTKITINCN